jgi:kinesin family protein 2/24
VNKTSSRSHAVLEFKLINTNEKVVSKMSFIDLAGSEKGSDVIDMEKKTKFDGAEINKSLLALKECIRALDSDKSYIN